MELSTRDPRKSFERSKSPYTSEETLAIARGLFNSKEPREEDESATDDSPLRADVKIVAAKGLKNRDSVGKSDPYCELFVNGVSKGRTEVRWNNLNPQWHSGAIKVRGLYPEDELEFKVWDDDRILPGMSLAKNRECLGSCKLTLPAVGEKKDEWLELVGTAEEVSAGESPQLRVVVQPHEVMQRQRTKEEASTLLGTWRKTRSLDGRSRLTEDEGPPGPPPTQSWGPLSLVRQVSEGFSSMTGAGAMVGVTPVEAGAEPPQRRRRRPTRTQTSGSPTRTQTQTPGGTPSESVGLSLGARKASVGNMSVESADMAAAGSVCNSVCSRGSSHLDGDSFSLREVWLHGPPRDSGSVLRIGRSSRGSGSWHVIPSFRATPPFGTVGNLERGQMLVFLRPASRARLIWELLTVILVVYDVLVVPMYPFSWPAESTIDVTDWIGRTFWTADIAASFLTGVFVDFELELRLREVAKHYAKSWMAFDVVLALSEWIPVFVTPTAAGSGTLRLLRFARILRFVKMEKAFEIFGSVCNSWMALWTNLAARQCLYLAAGIHLAACGWFWAGSRSPDGWVAREIQDRTDVDYRYLTSVHWAVSQLHGASEVGPGNTLESVYAILTLLLGLGSLCLLIASATSGVMQLEETRSSAAKQRVLIRSYLRKKNISRELSLAVKRCSDMHTRARNQEHKHDQAKEAVAFLPHNLRMEMNEEVRGPVVVAYSFFADLYEAARIQGSARLVRQLCHSCCSEKKVRAAEVVFAAGDDCAFMYFVTKGAFQYTRATRGVSPGSRPAGDSPGKRPASPDKRGADSPASEEVACRGEEFARALTPSRYRGEERALDRGSWLCEATLWTAWEHCGVLTTSAGGALLRLDAGELGATLRVDASAWAYASRYGREFLRQLNECIGHDNWSDVMDGVIMITREEILDDEGDSETEQLADDESRAAGFMMTGDPRLSPSRKTSEYNSRHYIFVSHHKLDAGTEATLMQESLERLILQDTESTGHHMDAPVFLDSEDLSDLTNLKDHVRNTYNLVLLLTEDVLKRPWVLIEIVTAFQSGVHVVPVEIYKRDNNSPFKYPDEQFYKKLQNGDLLTAADSALIKDEGISMDDLERALRHVFKKIAVPFSPHKSQNVREAELMDILNRCTDTYRGSVTYMSDFPSLPGNLMGATNSFDKHQDSCSDSGGRFEQQPSSTTAPSTDGGCSAIPSLTSALCRAQPSIDHGAGSNPMILATVGEAPPCDGAINVS
jgi:hypothetical protein